MAANTNKNEIIPCVCLTCGVRNDFSNPHGFCQNGHDDWLEYRDFKVQESNEIINRAMKEFNMTRTHLESRFMDSSNKIFK